MTHFDGDVRSNVCHGVTYDVMQTYVDEWSTNPLLGGLTDRSTMTHQVLHHVFSSRGLHTLYYPTVYADVRTFH